jgi:dihydroorotate dehydrogenase electron transfer subunit
VTRGQPDGQPGRVAQPAPAAPVFVRVYVIENRALASGIHWMELALPDDWGPPLPGQYVSLGLDPRLRESEPGRVGGGVLRRPFSIASFEAGDGHRRLGLLYAAVGGVTQRMVRLPAGGELDLLGPLGTAFPLDGREPLQLVAGGRGVAPMLFLARCLERSGRAFTFFYGARHAGEMIPLPGAAGSAPRLATDDGSCGRPGTVVELVAEQGSPAGTYFACGPHPMLATLAHWAQTSGTACWVSVEATFGCGLGTCGGCAVPAARPRGEFLWACRDGAVLPADAIDWSGAVRDLSRGPAGPQRDDMRRTAPARPGERTACAGEEV